MFHRGEFSSYKDVRRGVGALGLYMYYQDMHITIMCTR